MNTEQQSPQLPVEQSTEPTQLSEPDLALINEAQAKAVADLVAVGFEAE